MSCTQTVDGVQIWARRGQMGEYIVQQSETGKKRQLDQQMFRTHSSGTPGCVDIVADTEAQPTTRMNENTRLKHVQRVGSRQELAIS